MPRGVWTSPWQMSTADYQGRTITASIFLNVSTLAIINPGLTGFREPGCVYDRVIIGRPGAAQRVVLIPEGDFSVTRAVLANAGFSTIEQVMAASLTFGRDEAPT